MKMSHRSQQAVSRGLCAVLCLVMGIAVVAPSVAHAAGRRLVGLTLDNHLVFFSSASPRRIRRTVHITGLRPGEFIQGIDYRPGTGELFGIGKLNDNSDTNSVLYRIDQVNGAATPVGAPFFPNLIGISFGIDFNPVVDRLRVVSSADRNLRLNPTQGVGQVVDFDPNTPGTQPDVRLHYATTDPHQGQDPNVVAVAYTNPDRDPRTGTTLYGIDSVRNTLVLQGGPNGDPSPNLGQLFTVGSLGVDISNRAGFDIAKGSNQAFASFHRSGARFSTLYTIDLTTGAATAVGRIGSESNRVGVLRGLAIFIAPPPTGNATESEASAAEFYSEAAEAAEAE